MMRTYTTKQIRTAEAAALAVTADGVLMRRAAWTVAEAIAARLPRPLPGRRAVVLVGAGNNGGDGLLAGVRLARRGLAVTAILAEPDRTRSDWLTMLRRAGGRILDAAAADMAPVLARADVLIDALVGIGARPPLRPVAADLVTAANAVTALKVAVDVPSGLDPDTGAGDGPVFAADVTVTFGGAKTGLLVADAAGDVLLAPLGMDPAETAPAAGHDAIVIDDADAAAALTDPPAEAHKYSTGPVGIVAGSDRYPGAALLTVGAAVRLRPGMVRYVGDRGDAVLARWPEVVSAPDLAGDEKAAAWGVGPGMGTDAAAAARLAAVLGTDRPAVVDADGLTLLAQHPQLLAARVRGGAPTILTPHVGELRRLLPGMGVVDLGQPAGRLHAARSAAEKLSAIVLLKGRRTVVAAPDGRTAITTVGSPWLATAGSGDVLTGVLASLLATGLDAHRAAALAAHLHGRAGERAAAAGRAGASALLDLLR